MSRYVSELSVAVDALEALATDDLGPLTLTELTELTTLTARLQRVIERANRRVYDAIKIHPAR